MPTPNNPQRDKRTNGGKPHVCGEIAVHNTPTKGEVWLCNDCNLPVDSPDSPSPKSEVSGEEYAHLDTKWKEKVHNEIHLLVARVQSEDSLAEQIQHGNDFVFRFIELIEETLLSQREHDREEMKTTIILEKERWVSSSAHSAFDTILALLK